MIILVTYNIGNINQGINYNINLKTTQYINAYPNQTVTKPLAPLDPQWVVMPFGNRRFRRSDTLIYLLRWTLHASHVNLNRRPAQGLSYKCGEPLSYLKGDRGLSGHRCSLQCFIESSTILHICKGLWYLFSEWMQCYYDSNMLYVWASSIYLTFFFENILVGFYYPIF